MIFHRCKENVSHKTEDFPMAYYAVTEAHPRYHMIHHWHPETELILVRRGSLHLTVDGTLMELTEGDVVLIPPGAVHSGIPTKSAYDCAVFDGRQLTRILNGMAKKQYKNILSTPRRFSEKKEGHNSVLRLMNALRDREDGYELDALAAFFDLLSQWKNLPPSNGTPQKHRLLPFEQAVLYMQEHFQEPISLKDLAKASGLSENYFGEYFKNITGETPIQYLTDYRIGHAAELLRNEEKSITEIALECGFNDLSYFIKTFRKHYGIAPGKYRSNQQI